MKKLFIILTIIAICLASYTLGYLSTTTTTNLSLVKPAAEDLTVDWYDTMNDNMDLIDANSPKVKLDATSAPGVTNDTDEGYIAGSIWVDVTADKAYVCLDNTDGAAVWTETTGASGSGTVTTSGTPVANDIARFTGATVIEGLSYAEFKAALDLEIGTDIQALDTGLTSIAGLTTAANKMIYTTALDTYAVIDLTAFARTIIDDADASAVRTTLGLVIGTNVQASDNALTSISGLTYVSPSFIKLTANDTYAVRTLSEVKTDLSLVIGTDVLAEQTIGIANDNLPEVDDADAADNDFAKFTANGLEGRSYSETMEDLNPITTKTGTATLTVAEAGTIKVSAAAAYTLTLPTAVGHSGLRYHFIKTDANYNLITLDGDGAETFNYENSTGTPNTTYGRLNTLCAEVTLVSDNSNWQVINEALGQVPKARVYLSANQENLTKDIWNTVNYDTESYDIGSNYDTGNHKFVVPIAGKYRVSAIVNWRTVDIEADKRVGLSIYESANLKSVCWNHVAIAQGVTQFIDDIFSLSAADEIYIKAKPAGFTADTSDIDGQAYFGTLFMLIEKD